MADNVDEAFESGNEDMDRPPTPDFHLEGEKEDEASETSPRGSENSVESRSVSPKNEEEDGARAEHRSTGEKTLPTAENKQDMEDASDDNKSENVASPECSNEEEKEPEEIKNKSEMGDSDKEESVNEEKSEKDVESSMTPESPQTRTPDNMTPETPESDSKKNDEDDVFGDESNEGIKSGDEETEEVTRDKTDNDDKMEEDEEELEIPLSPIGDLGLSGSETAIVNDILKSDVTDMLPPHPVEERDEKVNEEGGDNDVVEGDEGKEASSDKEEEKIEKRKRPVISDDEDEDDDEDAGPSQPLQDKDQDEGSEQEEVGDQLIADIFGASDEEEEFEGFDQEDIEVTKKKKGVLSEQPKDEGEAEGTAGETDTTEAMKVPQPPKEESSDSEDGGQGPPVWDFDVIMAQKKKNRTKRRRRGDGDIISDNDDLVVEMIKQMKQAADDDKLLNEANQAATKKLKLLPVILKHMNKADLQYTFIDSGVLNVLKEWLSPLPDGSMPHLQIRTGILKILSTFPALDTGALKMSGLGRAVMYLYRHPKETRQNKQVAGKLINDWARPIFGVTSNFKSLSREEREERDYQNMSKRRRLSSADGEGGKTPRSIDSALQGEKKALRPGDKGFVMRARVPLPSNKDYVVRPKTNAEGSDFVRSTKKTVTKADKLTRKLKDKKRANKMQRAVNISIEGRKMNL